MQFSIIGIIIDQEIVNSGKHYEKSSCMWWIEYPPLFCSSRQLSVVYDIIIECACIAWYCV